jgi:hypothetical protein
MRKALLAAWLVSLAGLFCILGYSYLHGSTAERKSLLENVGMSGDSVSLLGVY